MTGVGLGDGLPQIIIHGGGGAWAIQEAGEAVPVLVKGASTEQRLEHSKEAG